MRHLPLLSLGASLAACEYDGQDSDEDLCANDTAAADWIELRVEHTPTEGAYVYTFQTGRGLNTCTFDGPLGATPPTCATQGRAAEVNWDTAGMPTFRAATDTWTTSFQATRDGEVLYESTLDPTWSEVVGTRGCFLHDEGVATISF